MKNTAARTQPTRRYENFTLENNLPLSIGANFHDDPFCRENLRKSHNLLLPKKVDYAPHTEYIYNGGGFTRGGKSRTESAADDDESDEDGVFNGWLSANFDVPNGGKDYVVRFLAYFLEDIPESPIETIVVRKVCIHYYTQDNSISVVEARQDNSGIVQSRILSRRQVPKKMDDISELITLDDFHIGGSIEIFQRKYYLLDMDERSRLYYKKIRGQEVPEAVPWPCELDKFGATIGAQHYKTTCRMTTSEDMDRKRAIEQQLTGIYTKHPTEDIIAAKKFLKHNINEHLTFLALWDDRENLRGDLRFCVIRIYLENDTFEIMEIRPENSGRIGGVTLLGCQRVPRPGVDMQKTRFQEHTFGVIMKRDFLVADDMRIGETYVIHGKPYYVYDADPFTREYMKTKLGIELAPKVDITPFVEVDAKGPIKFYPPPPNGFGSEREKRANWVTLTAKPQRPDFAKIEKEEGRVMRFLAELANPLVRGDEKRKFVISFYREKDEIEIFEKPERNSGFIAGRFLRRGVYEKRLPDGSTVSYTPEDFEVGKEIIVLERPFKLLAMDDETKRILEDKEVVTTENQVRDLLLLFKQQIQLKFLRVHEAYCTLAPEGVLGYRQVLEFLRSCSCRITDEEAVLLVQNIVPDSTGVISFDQFLNVVNITSSGHMDEASLTARSVKSVNMTKDETFKEVASKAERAKRRKKLAVDLRQKLIQRRGTTQEQFRLLGDHSSTSRLNRDVFRRSLNEIMHYNMSKEDEDMLVSILFDDRADENGDITYKQFQEFTDQDDSV
ncbi:protein associated with the ribbon compartment of flagellar microtubule [Trypanosoma rangeli]|uniref:EF-hand domain-containing family member C2 n=1 Tax=Trypanosoma rangeli TaxID=5698 RepID=A0A422N0Z6_TRYRA|nr:protein associated with the ribbon compartment of flagellar microtubule [Trypanosoma rangeli]RNE99120.1 protein associated with the ribbon compartment of flagellar microtubule [Trypanosoma rangeli]|eukprot:RNE99120.1 protein associated with the ribbon compartment of flagellar microtubule [Trypanosoma rangeli]